MVTPLQISQPQACQAITGAVLSRAFIKGFDPYLPLGKLFDMLPIGLGADCFEQITTESKPLHHMGCDDLHLQPCCSKQSARRGELHPIGCFDILADHICGSGCWTENHKLTVQRKLAIKIRQYMAGFYTSVMLDLIKQACENTVNVIPLDNRFQGSCQTQGSYQSFYEDGGSDYNMTSAALTKGVSLTNINELETRLRSNGFGMSDGIVLIVPSAIINQIISNSVISVSYPNLGAMISDYMLSGTWRVSPSLVLYSPVNEKEFFEQYATYNFNNDGTTNLTDVAIGYAIAFKGLTFAYQAQWTTANVDPFASVAYRDAYNYARTMVDPKTGATNIATPFAVSVDKTANNYVLGWAIRIQASLGAMRSWPGSVVKLVFDKSILK